MVAGLQSPPPLNIVKQFKETVMSSTTIYENLCSSRKLYEHLYKKGSGLHKHHILPKHSEGLDVDENYTYLTVREHIIAHYLLWRIYKNPNDLRSMKMLGANLSLEYRKIVGLWCVVNKIGFYSDRFTGDEKSSWRLKGLETQKSSGNKNSFYYWSTEEGRKERASLGGKASLLSGNNSEWMYWSSPAGRKERAVMGGKSHLGKKCMYYPGDISFIRVLPELVNEMLVKGYILGSPIKPNKNIKMETSKRKRSCTDGVTIFDSIASAASENNVSQSAIVLRCQSKKSIWCYCDI